MYGGNPVTKARVGRTRWSFLAAALGGADNWRVRGGEHTDPFDQQFCGQDYVEARGVHDPSTGFRCCADPLP